MKKYLVIIGLIVAFSMCFSIVALGGGDYEMPTIPLTGSTSSTTESTSEEESSEDTGIITGMCGDNVTYSLDIHTGVLTISGTGAMTDYSDSYLSPFATNEDIVEVIVENGVTSVGDYTFYQCYGIESVSLPETVERIGSYSFSECEALVEFEIPDSVTIIDNCAFMACINLESVDFGSGVQTIREQAFRNCSMLEEINIPASVTSIGFSSFYLCSNIQGITVAEGNEYFNCPDNCNILVKTETDEVILGCRNSTVPEGIKAIGSNAFSGCVDLISIELPESLTTISNYAFYNCRGLTRIIIPSMVTDIGVYAFYNCSQLKVVTFQQGLETIGNNAFVCSSLAHVCYTGTSTEWKQVSVGTGNASLKNATMHYNCYDYCDEHSFVTSVTEPTCTMSGYTKYQCTVCGYSYNANFTQAIGHNYSASVVEPTYSSGGYTTYTCTRCGDSYIGDYTDPLTDEIVEGVCGENLTYTLNKTTGVLTISGTGEMYEYNSYYKSPFYADNDIITVVINNGVTNISDNAFENCSALTTISTPDSVTSVGESAFRNCSVLQNITLTDSITHISAGAFFGTAYYNNDNNWNDNVLYIGNHLISAKEEISGSYSINENTVTIAGNAFQRCTGLTGILLPDSVTSVGDAAFTGCTGLTSVNIPDSVTSIGNGAFSSCTDLTEVNINSIESWCNISFADGYANPLMYAHSLYLNDIPVTDLVIPSDVERICDWAFKDCTSLESVTISDGVTAIGDRAFDGCSALASLTIPISVNTIGSVVFYECTGLRDIYYAGTAEQWNSIIGDNTEELVNTTIHFNSSGGEIIIDEPDFDALNAILARIPSLNEDDYSAESFAALTEACSAGEALLNQSVSQSVIDYAVQDILTAITDLVPYVNLTVIRSNGDADSGTDTQRLLKGDSVTLECNAADGYEFAGWYDYDTKRVVCNTSDYTFTIKSNTTVEVRYRKVGKVSLIFQSSSGQVVKTVEKTAEEWSAIESLASLEPDVPFSFGNTNGRWNYNNDAVLLVLAAGRTTVITPIYDEAEADVPELPNADEEPAATLTYVLDENTNIASFLLAVDIPDGCEVEEIGTALYYKKAADFNPTDYELVINDKVLTSKFTDTEDGVYITNISKFSNTYNWAVRGYITYRDSEGNLKTVYSNQINIVDRQQV